MQLSRRFFGCFARKLSSVAGGGGCLEGIKVVDMSRILAGPYCTMVMGDMGATVYKIEHPEGGDDSRKWGPPFVHGESCYFLSINRNKQSVAINFKSKEGARLIQQLVCKSDVLVENFLPGTLEKYGLDYTTLSRLNPRLIYASISSYGASGPDSKLPGYDVIVSARGGLMGITGEEKPAKVGVAQTDIATGLFMNSAIVAALFKRERTGVGQQIDTSLLEVQVGSLANIGQNYLTGGLDGKRWGTAHASIVPYQAFATKDSFIAAGALNDKQFVSMCELMGVPNLAENQKFVTNQLRVKNRQELIATLSDIFRTRDTSEWLSLLHVIPCAPVNTIKQVFTDEQVLARDMILKFDHPTVGPMQTAGFPIKFSESPCAFYRPPPLLGEHTRSVLNEELDVTEEQLDELQRDKVIKTKE